MKKFMVADLKKAIEPDYVQLWRQKQYPEQFNFSINPSKTSWNSGSMAEDPAEVDAFPIWESIGEDGEDTPYYYVDVNWPSGNAKSNRAYEMDLDTIEAWSNDTSGTYFNDNIRGNYS